MAANHSSICKFEDPNGPDYKQVIGNLQELIEGAIKVVKDRERLHDLSVPVASIGHTKACTYLDRISLNFMDTSPLTTHSS
jgi:hypothetical protein